MEPTGRQFDGGAPKKSVLPPSYLTDKSITQLKLNTTSEDMEKLAEERRKRILLGCMTATLAR